MNDMIDELGRCEVCGHYVPEVDLTEFVSYEGTGSTVKLIGTLTCNDCL